MCLIHNDIRNIHFLDIIPEQLCSEALRRHIQEFEISECRIIQCQFYLPMRHTGIYAQCLYATVILLNKFIKTVGGIHRTFLQFLAAIAVLIPYVLTTSGCTLGSMNGTGWVCLLVVGLIHTGITYCMYFTALKDLPGQEAAILSYVDPLVAVLISVTLLSEPMTLMQVIGGLLILGFTLWNEIEPKKE